MTQKKERSRRTLYLVQLAILVAILLMLDVTGLGYIKIGAISMTIMQVPVIIGAIVLGPGAGLVLGAVFGWTSFAQAFGKDLLGAELLKINPFGLFITTVITRTLMGWLTGIIFKAIYKALKKLNISLILGSFSGAFLNTLFFMTALIAFFYNTPTIQSIVTTMGSGNALVFALSLVGLQGLIEAVLCTLLGSAIARALLKYTKKYVI